VLVIVSITVVFFTTSQACADMFGFFNKQEFYLSAPVKGQLLDNARQKELFYGTRLFQFMKKVTHLKSFLQT